MVRLETEPRRRPGGSISVPVAAQSFEQSSSGPSDEADAVVRGIARGYPKPFGATRCVLGRATLVEEGEADSEAETLNNQLCVLPPETDAVCHAD